MPTAICKACSTTRPWSNQRGTKLSDMRCNCGGEFARAQWRDGKYQMPMPKTPRPKAPSFPETSTGVIWGMGAVGSAYESLPARAGDLVTLWRNGYRGSYEGRILAFKGRKVKIELLRHDGRGLETVKRIWVRRGIQRLLPQPSPDQVQEALADPKAFLEKHGKPTTVFAELDAARAARLADAPLIDPDEVQKGRDWSELGQKVFGGEAP